MEVAPTFHIARFLPSITESKAPFTFALQVSTPSLSALLFMNVTSPFMPALHFLLPPSACDLHMSSPLLKQHH